MPCLLFDPGHKCFVSLCLNLMCLDIHDLWKYTARAFVNQKSTRMAFTVLQWLLATFLARLAQWLHLLQPSVVWMQWHGPRSGTCLTFDPYPLLLDASTGVISFKTYQMKYKWYSETYLDIYDQDKYRFSCGLALQVHLFLYLHSQ